MKHLNKTTLISILLALFVMVSCKRHNAQLQAFADADGYNKADSLVSAIGDERDFERLLVVTDSLERKGELTEVRAIFYKTIAYNIMGQHNTSLRLYYKLANFDIKNLTCKADLESYIYSYKDYVRLLCDMRRYDRALREAHAADHKLRKAGFESFIEHQDIAQMIGECQLYLGQADEAARSFEKALKGVEIRLINFHDPLDYRECQKTLNAIARAYIHTNRYQEAIPWIERQDSLFFAVDRHPQRDSVFVDEMKADINYSKALVAHNLGKTDIAERAFAAYQSTRLSKQLGSIINSNEYLMLTKHYEEAARNYTQLEKYMKTSGYKADLEAIGRYMLPKFRANLLAGNRDSALYVANLVAEYYDTALVRQKAIDADLISTIYDTEGKERQIAEQRAKLSNQRLISVAVVMGIILLFFYIYSMQRRRAYRRLDAKNHELQEANERAEESSRMKTKFIQQISHEVRTPLNVLSGFSQVLATPDIEIDSYELKNISQKIVENSDRITKLVDKMLDLSMINSNADIECGDTVSPADIARKAIEESGIRNATHLEFQLEVSKEIENTLFKTHKKSAVKALTLLLDNAIKFTHPLAFKGQHDDKKKAHVTLSINVTKEQVMFIVEDTGIGIPNNQAENIFTEFVQLDEYSDGTGIGLSIARSLARHMQGDIILDTSYKDGARFVMSLHL
jgi:signal transduction histidine kinase